MAATQIPQVPPPPSSASKAHEATGDDPPPSLIFQEFQADAESGDSLRARAEPPGGDVEGNDSLARLLRAGLWPGSADALRECGTNSRVLPHAGDEVMGFRLDRELGRGAFARVFLAEQAALAGRRVAVKISRAKRDESQTLAQLQHTHIVPIYSAHADPVTGLRMLVMPYFGGTTLDRLLAKAGLRADPRATGRSLITALDGLAPINLASGGDGSLLGVSTQNPSASTPASPPSLGTSYPSSPWLPSRLLGRAFLGTWRSSAATLRPIGQPARHLLERSNYIQAVTWIAARLAEALAHAHQRGILHRDIKPSNVLIGSDGQPMLLDFNLARDAKTDDRGTVAYLGGTLPYMAPEHLDAFNAENPTPPTAVDERSDVYSLGVVLFEMLTGKHPFHLEPPGESLPTLLERMAHERRGHAPSARLSNPTVPRSLDAVVRRCLDPEPARRYPEAAQLAEDLQRELDNLPLRHTREPSLVERFRKWMRRHPRWASAGPLAAISGVALVLLGGLVLMVGGRLFGYDSERRWLKFQEGLVKAQCLVHTGHEPGENLPEGRKVCRQTLALFDVLSDPDWLQTARVERLSPTQQAKLPDMAIELVLLLARVDVAQAKLSRYREERNGLLEDAVEMLDRAERFQESAPRALYEDRSHCRRLLGDTKGAERDWDYALATPLRTARDHYLLATSLAVEKRYEAALTELEIALRLDPKHFWAHFELGICYDQLGRHTEAVGVYRSCICLWPDFPLTYLNRGVAYSRQENWAGAIQDYSKAIQLDENFGDAYVNRGLAYLNRTRYAEAVKDLSQALKLGKRSGTVWAARAAARAGLREFDQAGSDYDEALEASPGEASILLSRGFALARQAPEQALADFDRVLDRHPEWARAHYGRALVLGDLLGRTSEAVQAAEQALAADPALDAARCALAVLAGRAGDYDRAIEQAEVALEHATSGPTCYAAACAYALASRSNEEYADRALELLQKALEQKYGRDQIHSDPDLEPIRSDPRFAQVAAGGP